jgi:NitT/TauT family transport system substrate-binding protein
MKLVLNQMHSWLNSSKNAAYLLVATLLLLCLVSCDLHKAPPSGVQPAPPLQVFNVGYLNLLAHLPLNIVDKKKPTPLTGFSLATKRHFDWHDVVDNIKNGKLDGAFILSPLAMDLARNGFPGKIVLIANRDGNSFVLSNKILSIADLNKRQSIIAVPHIYSQHNVLLSRILSHYGIPKDNIKLVQMPPGNMGRHLRNGTIDGFVVGEPEGNRALKLNYGWSPTLPSFLVDRKIDHVFFVSNAIIQEHPEKLQALVEQLLRSGILIESARHKPLEIAQLFELAGVQFYEDGFASIPRDVTFDNIIASEADIISMAQKLVDMALWPDTPNALTMTYFDMSFAKKAQRNLESTIN